MLDAMKRQTLLLVASIGILGATQLAEARTVSLALPYLSWQSVGHYTYLNILVQCGNGSSRNATLFDGLAFQLTPGDNGDWQTIASDEDDADLGQFSECITNGQNDTLSLFAETSGGGPGWTRTESEALSQMPDLEGYRVDSVTMRITGLRFAFSYSSPCRPYPIGCTDVRLSGATVKITYSVPEPGSILQGLTVAGVLIQVRRMRLV